MVPQYTHNKILSALTVFACATLALFFTQNILSTDANELGRAYFFIGGICFISAFFNPKLGFFLLFTLCAYSDLVKRLMWLWGNISMFDVATSLSAAPLCLAGLLLGTFLNIVLGRIIAPREAYLSFVAICIISVISMALLKVKSDYSIFDILKSFANGTVYMFTIPLIITYFPSWNSLLKLFKMIICIFIPVPLYGLYQLFSGLNSWEIGYLQSGLSIEVRQLDEAIPRPFSTLNSAFALSAICCILTIFCIVVPIVRQRRWTAYFSSISMLLFSILYSLGLFASLTRTAWISFLIFIITFLCFQRRSTTVALYTSVGILFLSLYPMAETLLRLFPYWQQFLPQSSDLQEQAFRIRTFEDRLVGFYNVYNNSSLWTFFGVPDDRLIGQQVLGDDTRLGTTSDVFVHDAFNSFIISRGIIPTIILGGCLMLLLLWIHRKIRRLNNLRAKLLCQFLLSSIIGIFAMLVASPEALDVFPVNCFFWLLVGSLLSLLATHTNPSADEELPLQSTSYGNSRSLS